jgi:hypothetical protein
MFNGRATAPSYLRRVRQWRPSAKGLAAAAAAAGEPAPLLAVEAFELHDRLGRREAVMGVAPERTTRPRTCDQGRGASVGTLVRT